jgi:GYF domain 2
MAGQSWFVAMDGKPAGPYPEAQFQAFVAQGSFDRDTLVWCEGMSSWQRAGYVPGLIPSADSPRPRAGAQTPDSENRFFADFNAWPLFGMLVLYVIGMSLILPAPWVGTALCRWIVRRVYVPGRPNLSFEGRLREIWYAFLLLALLPCFNALPAIYLYLEYLPQFSGSLDDFLTIWPYLLAAPLLGVACAIFCWWLIFKWVVMNIATDGRRLPLSFDGGFFTSLAWYIGVVVSTITIVGWAWVVAACMRWVCRNIAGSVRGVFFAGSGWQILWRSWVFSFLCALIVPIPWTVRWYARWWASQFAVGVAMS